MIISARGMSKMENRYKKLLSNSFLFMVAQFGSKVLMLVVVPLYTYFLTTSEYGAIELSTTTLTIAAPCCMLLIYDAVMRFTMIHEISKIGVLTSALRVFFLGALLSLIVIPISYAMTSLRPYTLLVYFLIVSYGLFYIFSQYSKGINVKVFVFSGILYTVVFLGCNLLFIVHYRMAVTGYILSQIIGYLTSTCYCFIRLNAWKFIDFRINTKDITRQMLSYSVLLIPNALVWWIIASANRYFIEGFFGVDANGIYGIAAKIPNVITMVGTIFIQAWQLSAIDEKEQNSSLESRRHFFTNVFNTYSAVLVIGSSLIILFCKPLLPLILSNEFKDAWRYVPFLLLSSVYMMYAQFWSSLFVAEKSSKELSTSSIASGMLSVIFNWIFIPIWGLTAAAIVCFISCFVMWIIRMISARKYNMIIVNMLRENIVLILLLVQCSITMLLPNIGSFLYFINAIIFITIVILYRKSLVYIIQMGKVIVHKK